MARSVKKPTVLYLSSYPPKECGVGAYTHTLVEGIRHGKYSDLAMAVAAIEEDNLSLRKYGKDVLWEVSKQSRREYIKLAKRINSNPHIKLLHIQHQFNLFGGKQGAFLETLLPRISIPVVATIHTVHKVPIDEEAKRIVTLCKYASAIIVMTNFAKELLLNVYNVSKPVFVIPHGIPDIPFRPSSVYKSHFHLRNKTIITSFGLLEPRKGIEYVLNALPDVIKKHKTLTYLIIGATHPTEKAKNGESYRNSLVNLVHKLKLERHVKFYNKYLEQTELLRVLGATDIALCTNLGNQQVSSGTLTYALGVGRPVIATAFPYANEVLNDSVGRIVPFKDSDAIAESLIELLANPHTIKNMKAAAYKMTRGMSWKTIAQKHLEIYSQFMKF